MKGGITQPTVTSLAVGCRGPFARFFQAPPHDSSSNTPGSRLVRKAGAFSKNGILPSVPSAACPRVPVSKGPSLTALYKWAAHPQSPSMTCFCFILLQIYNKIIVQRARGPHGLSEENNVCNNWSISAPFWISVESD